MRRFLLRSMSIHYADCEAIFPVKAYSFNVNTFVDCVGDLGFKEFTYFGSIEASIETSNCF